MNIKKDLCELDPDEVPFYTDEDISLALADDDEVQSENGISNTSLLWILRDTVKIKIAYGWPEEATGENVCSSRSFN